MSKILVADLSKQSISRDKATDEHYGRGLAVHLLKEHTPLECSRLSPDNAFIVVPGLFTGSLVSCATRAVVAARGDGGGRLAISNITGDFPQKLASLDLAAVVVKGKAETGNAVLYIDEDEAKLLHLPELRDLTCGEIVEHLRSRFGDDAAIIGSGPIADMGLLLSNLFTSYPEGTPRYTCPRNSFGDVPGSKGLKAIVVKTSKYFAAPCADKEALKQANRELTQHLINDPICGGALPGLGSITILHLLKNKEAIPSVVEKTTTAKHSQVEGRVNYTCAPLCAIGCLNRHSSSSNQVFAAPEVAEVRAAMEHCFAANFSEVDLDRLAAQLSARGFELGLNTTEFINTVALYLQVKEEQVSEENLTSLMEEIAAGSLLGRLLGSTTTGLGKLYPTDERIQARITRPANRNEDEQQLKLDSLYPDFKNLDDLDLLYRQVFLVENLGICIFTAFALLNKKDTMDLLAELYSHKTGQPANAEDLLHYAGSCLAAEEALQRESALAGVKRSIPEFVKVLYTYFSA